MDITGDRIRIRVKPNSRKAEIISFKDGIYLITLKSLPQDNKANIELVKFLTKETGRRAHIVSGLTSKSKTVEFR